MLTIQAGTSAHAEIEVKKSRFISVVAPAANASEARQVIDAEKSRYPDARHHCSAYVLESAGATPQVHFSDDGEPAGTAGAPMLEVLTGRDLVNVVAVVTRYFGGTLLGTGGLVRAYSDATVAALDHASLAQIRHSPTFEVVLDPASAGKIESELRRQDWVVLDTQWGADVTMVFSVPQKEELQVEPLILSLTRGEGLLTRVADRRHEVPLR